MSETLGTKFEVPSVQALDNMYFPIKCEGFSKSYSVQLLVHLLCSTISPYVLNIKGRDIKDLWLSISIWST